MRKVFQVLLWISLLAAAGCRPKAAEEFSIYLLKDQIPPAQLAITGLYALQLQDQPLLSSQDILAYYPESHQMDLTAGAYQRVQNLFSSQVKVSGIPFVVVVGCQRIYSGAFWTQVSSLSFDGVVILQPFDETHYTLRLALGYPSSNFFTGIDPRSDARILQALRAAGKLK